ncbi:MAG: LuxR C-terminal-related transcriptional regulator [Steroidobacteraceae bacterium]
MASVSELEKLSRIVLDLYNSPPREPAPAFRQRALDELAPYLPYTGAAWAHGVMTPRGAVFHDILVRGLSPGFADAVRATADLDSTSHKLAAASGQSFIHVQDDYPPEVRQLAGDPDDLCSSLEGMVADGTTGVFSSVCLFRNSRQPAFSETERVLHQNLLPHWIAALSRRIIDDAFIAARGVATANLAVAVAGKDGALEAASEGFAALLRTEWPSWPGGSLPPELLRSAVRTESTFLGDRVVARISRLPERMLLCARARLPVDSLGRRELQVAELLGAGLGVKPAAKKLGLSPSTVENHRDHIYRKLGVSSRSALIAVLRESALV